MGDEQLQAEVVAPQAEDALRRAGCGRRVSLLRPAAALAQEGGLHVTERKAAAEGLDEEAGGHEAQLNLPGGLHGLGAGRGGHPGAQAGPALQQSLVAQQAVSAEDRVLVDVEPLGQVTNRGQRGAGGQRAFGDLPAHGLGDLEVQGRRVVRVEMEVHVVLLVLMQV